VSPGTDLKNRIARALAAHALRVAVPDRAEWTKAMMHEQEHLPPDASALSWALGCAFVSYRARLRSMTRLPDLPRWAEVPRWAQLTIWLLCFGPPIANFIPIVDTTAHGHPLWWAGMLPYPAMQEGLIFGSATLIEPIGLAAALWALSSPAHRLGTTFMVALWTLTALATVYVGVPALSAEWRAIATPGEIFSLVLNFVLLPALGVALLQRLDACRRPAAAQGA
jgi:hypothetical protein